MVIENGRRTTKATNEVVESEALKLFKEIPAESINVVEIADITGKNTYIQQFYRRGKLRFSERYYTKDTDTSLCPYCGKFNPVGTEECQCGKMNHFMTEEEVMNYVKNNIGIPYLDITIDGNLIQEAVPYQE